MTNQAINPLLEPYGPDLEKEAGTFSFSTADLGRRTFAGFLWLLLGKGYRQLLFLASTVILARLLSPRDFGLVALGTLAIHFISVFTYTGFHSALVQRPHLSFRIINTAWWVTLGRAGLIALILWFAAPLISKLFHEPDAVPIIRALGIIQFLSGFTSIGVVLLNKDLKFGQLFVLEALGQTFDLIVAVSIALLWRNAWALVLGATAGAMTRVVISYLLYPYRPRVKFDVQAARSLFTYGQWLLYSAVLFFSISKGTDVLSGLIFGTTALGLYQMASRFALLPTNHFGELFLATLFPAYSHIQHEPERLKETFLRVLQVATLVIFPLSTLMAVAVGPVLPLVLGEKWQGVVYLVPPLALGGALQALLRTGSPLFLATGQPRYQFFMDLASMLGIILCLYPMAYLFGLAGLAWSYALGIACGLPIWWRLVIETSGLGARQILLALLVYLPVKLFLMPLTSWQALSWLTLLSIAGLLAFIGLIYSLERYIKGYEPVGATLNLISRICHAS